METTGFQFWAQGLLDSVGCKTFRQRHTLWYIILIKNLNTLGSQLEVNYNDMAWIYEIGHDDMKRGMIYIDFLDIVQILKSTRRIKIFII